jgi:hypothetical protein
MLPVVVVCGLRLKLARHDARHRAASRGLCAGCGYNLTLNVSGVCPECGAPAGAVTA